MDRQSIARIKSLSRRHRKDISKEYVVKGRRRRRTLQFLRPELYAYAYQIEGSGNGSPIVVVSITNAGGAPSDNTVVKLFLPNGRVLKQRTSVQSGQTKTVVFEWSGSLLPADKVSTYHLLCFDPLNDPIGGGLTTEAIPQKRNFIRGGFPDRPWPYLQIVNGSNMEKYLLDYLISKYYQSSPITVHQEINSMLNGIISTGIPDYVPDALYWLQTNLSQYPWTPPGSTISSSFDRAINISDIQWQYEHYSDLQDWVAYRPSANGFTTIDSPNGWRAQDDEALSGVCIATTELTQPNSELHQTVTMNAQTIGATARSFLGQGDLLASLSGTIKVNNSAIISTLGLDCLDNAGNLLATVRTSSPPTHGQWYRVAASFALPPNTAQVRTRLLFDRSSAPAVSHNAVFGDLSLTFTHRQVYYGNLRT